MKPAGGEVRARSWLKTRDWICVLNEETHTSLPCSFPKELETRSRELNQKQEKQLQVIQLRMSASTATNVGKLLSAKVCPCPGVLKQVCGCDKIRQKAASGRRHFIWLTSSSYSLL